MATRKKVSGRKFPAELKNIMAEYYGGNMAEYSRASKVASGTLGHYLVSNRYPSPDRMECLLRPLQGKAQQRLLEAYLMDLVPPAMRPQIKVTGTGSAKAATAPAAISGDLGVSKKTLSALEFLGGLAADNQAVRQMLEQTARAMGWAG